MKVTEWSWKKYIGSKPGSKVENNMLMRNKCTIQIRQIEKFETQNAIEVLSPLIFMLLFMVYKTWKVFLKKESDPRSQNLLVCSNDIFMLNLAWPLCLILASKYPKLIVCSLKQWCHNYHKNACILPIRELSIYQS